MMRIYSKVWMKGFSTFSMVCACLNPPPCIKGAFFFPSSKVLVSQPVFLENFPHVRRISQGQVFSHSEGSRSRLQKIKIKNLKSRRQTHTPGKNTCHRTLQICIKHAMCFSQWYVPVLIVYFILFYLFLPGGPGEEPLEFLPPEVP